MLRSLEELQVLPPTARVLPNPRLFGEFSKQPIAEDFSQIGPKDCRLCKQHIKPYKETFFRKWDEGVFMAYNEDAGYCRECAIKRAQPYTRIPSVTKETWDDKWNSRLELDDGSFLVDYHKDVKNQTREISLFETY